jgi:hypothetical protein
MIEEQVILLHVAGSIYLYKGLKTTLESNDSGRESRTFIFEGQIRISVYKYNMILLLGICRSSFILWSGYCVSLLQGYHDTKKVGPGK